MSELECLIANQFKKLTGVSTDENQILSLPVFPQKREPLKQLLRSVLPNLRIRSSEGLVTVADFANYVETAQVKKNAFFSKGLEIIRTVTGNDRLSFDDDLYSELRPVNKSGNAYLSEQCRYFIKANKVYAALSKGLRGKLSPYCPPVSQLENCRNLLEIIDLFYRRGKF